MTGSKDLRQLTFGPRMTLPPFRWGAGHVHLLGGPQPAPTECVVPASPKSR